MNYYRLTITGSHASGSDIVDSDGKPIEPTKELTDFPYYFYTDRNDPRPLGDLMSAGFSPLVVSALAGELLADSRYPKHTHFFPVILLAMNFDDDDDKSREIIGEGRGILFDWPEEEVMTDEDARIYKTYSPLDRVQGKSPPPVVQRRVIERYDMFHGIGLGILVSDRVKAAVEDADLTNFRFLPVDAR